MLLYTALFRSLSYPILSVIVLLRVLVEVSESSGGRDGHKSSYFDHFRKISFTVIMIWDDLVITEQTLIIT